MNVDRYLDRIGLPRPSEPNLHSLRALHRPHLLATPYETLEHLFGERGTP